MMRRTLAGIVIGFVAISGIGSGLLIVNAIGAQCHYAQKQYDALHRVIIEQNRVQPPSPLLFKFLPEFRAFFTPGTAEYNEAHRIADAKRDAQLEVQGSRPTC